MVAVMKRILFTAVLTATCSVVAHAQTGGTVNFANKSSTRLTNSITSNPVSTNDGVKAGLYWAPLNSGTFTLLGSPVTVGIPLPGIFAGGTRTNPPPPLGATTNQFQVRAWSGNYTNYEQAASQPGGLVGQSAIILVLTGNPAAGPPTPPNSLTGLSGFVLTSNIVSTAIDIGLRVFDGTTNNRIAVQPGPPTSPFRVNKGGTNYGILLVPTNSPNASRIRIQTTNGVMAWQKL
jgi:hypothetical protein